ncbi:MAG: family 43 glycosylhydrolase [Candidatus Hodarchaeota archaeon]
MSNHPLTVQESVLRGDVWIRDPNIQYFNDTYYMTGTCSNAGIKIYNSTDLENWDNGTLAYVKNDSNPWIDANFWAPEMHVREDVNGTATFYLYFSGVKDGKPRRTGCAVASAPLGPYEDYGPMINDSGIMKVDALTPPDVNCLDGTLFYDPLSGKEYFIYSYEWINDESETGQMWIQEMASNYSCLLGEPVSLWRGGDAIWSNGVIDGPFVWYYNDRYYMLWSSFSSGTYTTGYASADDLLGPWEQEAWPVINTHGGHASLFLINQSWDKIGDVSTDVNMADLRISFHQPNSGGDPHCIIAKFYYGSGRWQTDPSYTDDTWKQIQQWSILFPYLAGVNGALIAYGIALYLIMRKKKPDPHDWSLTHSIAFYSFK